FTDRARIADDTEAALEQRSGDAQPQTAGRASDNSHLLLAGIRTRDNDNAPFNTYFLFIVRSRNSCINDPIRSTSSSNAKWPVSRRWSSALGISLLKSSAPSTVKIPSFLPQVISVGGCCSRKYSCQSAKTCRSLFSL